MDIPILIQKSLPKMSHYFQKEKLMETKSAVPEDLAISMRNITCTWTTQENIKEAAFKQSHKKQKLQEEKDPEHPNEPPTLSNISIDIKKGHLVGIIGHVGSGKSSLLQVILKEMDIQAGSLVVRGSTAYTNQEPWIFNSTIRQNIIFGLEYDKDQYDKTVNACGLDSDFKQFPYGDLTAVGEKTLSGGQKARVSLARAVYRASDIILLDDPLSAVGEILIFKFQGSIYNLLNFQIPTWDVTYLTVALAAKDC